MPAHVCIGMALWDARCKTKDVLRGVFVWAVDDGRFVGRSCVPCGASPDQLQSAARVRAYSVVVCDVSNHTDSGGELPRTGYYAISVRSGVLSHVRRVFAASWARKRKWDSLLSM